MWLKHKLLNRKSPSARVRRKSFRPLLEALENRLAPAAHTWTGGSLDSANWSDAANWAEGIPTPGESNVTLLFPDAARTTITNNLEGLTVAALRFTGTGYSISGHDLIFRGDT